MNLPKHSGISLILIYVHHLNYHPHYPTSNLLYINNLCIVFFIFQDVCFVLAYFIILILCSVWHKLSKSKNEIVTMRVIIEGLSLLIELMYSENQLIINE